MNNSEILVHTILQLSDYYDKLEEADEIKNKNELISEEIRRQGNTLYKKGKHNEAEHRKLISLYTSSIAFAPNDSEELPRGFSNRSLALMHLHLYEEALADIDRALQISKSDNLKAKLVSRKERCLKLKNNDKKLPDELPELLPSAIIPNASEAVAIEYSERFGRHLIATRDIKPGEIIVVEESYTGFPKEDRIYLICSHCLRFTWNGIPCDNCVFAIFCSEECKNEAMQEYHDIECPMISSMFFTFKAKITHSMVTVRLFIKAIKSEGLTCVINEIKRSSEEIDNVTKLLYDGVLDSNKFRSYYNLESYAPNEEKYLDLQGSLIIVTLLLRHTTIIPNIPIQNMLLQITSTDTELLLILSKAFLRLRNILSCNTFRYQALICNCKTIDECKVSCEANSGTIIAATCSLINHSCCPNVSRIFLPKRKMVFFATASITKDQPLCDSYGPEFFLEKKERQDYLKENYHFLCSCQACEENWPIDIKLTIVNDSIATSQVFDTFMKEFGSYCPDEKSSPQDIITQFMDQSYYEKSTLEKVLILCNLLYKYFGYREAYYHCYQFIKRIEMSFLRCYGEHFVMPKGC